MAKRKLLFNTNFALLKTGFGRAAKCILSYLYETGKYEIISVCGGFCYNDPQLERTPWKSLGVCNNQQELHQIQDAGIRQLKVYGAFELDKIIQEEKIFAFFGIEDFWAFNCFDAPWFNKIHSTIWTTLDSVPLLPQSIGEGHKIKNYWVWADFAEAALKKAGINHVKTIYGPIDPAPFYKLSDKEKFNLREKFGIPADAFVASFVYRNQLRKLVPNTLEGFKKFKEQNNIKNAYLLFHTHFSEAPGNSWDIPRLMNEFKISPSEVLVTHICKNCKDYTVQSFLGQEKKCPYCGDDKGLITTSPGLGVTEKQLNEIYNLSSVYLHCMTSGGLEYPLVEAKLCELITLVNPYSSGETFTQEGAQSFPIDYAEYWDVNSHFIKASPYPNSIAKQLLKVYNMKPEKRAEMGRKARQWALERFDIKVIGKFIENFIDGLPDLNYDYKWDYQPRNPTFVIPEIQDDTEWLKVMYKNILFMDDPGSGLEYWLAELKKGINRCDIEKFFRQTAIQENQKNQKIEFKDILGPESWEDRILFCIPKSIGDCFLCTSLFKSINELYPDKKLYVACENGYMEVFEGNPYVFRTIQWQGFMDNILPLEGVSNIPALFYTVYVPHFSTQRQISYTHGGRDKGNIELNYNRENLPLDGRKTPVLV